MSAFIVFSAWVFLGVPLIVVRSAQTPRLALISTIRDRAIMSFSNRRGQCFFNSHAAFDTPKYGFSVYTNTLGPFSNSVRLVAISVLSNVALIVVLLGASSPTTISRFVSFFVINALYGVLWSWTYSHIGKEVLERVTPAVTDRNASASVVRIRFILWIQAACLYMAPDIIFWRFCHAVSGSSFNRLFNAYAATGFGVSHSQVRTIYDGCISTIAETFPIMARVISRINHFASVAYSNKTTKTFSSKVNDLRHNVTSMNIIITCTARGVNYA